MNTYTVDVVIENKPAARDPEGETISRDLMNKGGYTMVKSVRTGKHLRVLVDAKTKEQAKKTVFDMCNSLRIYNPVVHTCKIELKDLKK
ncbi:MAG: phosphoribosylformylglycinamidine synthase subunit PurS [Candidatus Bathyarchaeota archaeon]